MATWIYILHMIFPIRSDLPAPGVVIPSADAADGAVRYRGLEQMFARFAAEAEPG